MKKNFIVPVLLLVAVITGFTACQSAGGENVKFPISQDSLINRGAYLVTAMGCNDCHTPKIMTPRGPALDSTRLLSGHRSGVALPPANKDVLKNGWALFYGEGTAMISPVGTSFAANLTSDETGIGNWSYQQFKTALTRGKWKGLESSRDLLPPMPSENYRNLKEDDIQSIFAYLKSTTPVSNVVPAPILAEAPGGKTAADH